MDDAIPRHALYETEAMLRALELQGAVLIPGALDASICAMARAAIDALRPVHWDETRDDAHSLRVNRALDRYLCVFNRAPFWLRFLDRPGVIDLAEAALGPDCHVIGETAWRSHPGFRGEPLHADYLPLTWPDGALPDTVRVPMYIITAHFYLCDVPAELGPTRLIAGSHRAGRAPDADERDWHGIPPQMIIAREGDALVFRSDLWHAGSDNTTRNKVRYLLQVHYGRREMAQHYSPLMAWKFDPAIVAAASRRQRRLLGDHEPGPYD